MGAWEYLKLAEQPPSALSCEITARGETALCRFPPPPLFLSPEPLGSHHYHDYYIQSGVYILICSVYIKESWNQWLSETHLTFGRTANFLFQCCRLFNLPVLKK